jgi:FMN phosphatase YigB (HAD superfamily)
MISDATPMATPATEIAVITLMTAWRRLARRYREATKNSNFTPALHLWDEGAEKRKDAAHEKTRRAGDERQIVFHRFDCSSDYNSCSCLRMSLPPMKTTSSRPRHGKGAATKPLIRAVIFDLDDTLYDCFRQRVRVSHRHAAQAMVQAGLKATVEAVYRARMRAFVEDPMLRHIDAVVCRRFGAGDPEAVSHAAREAYFNCPVGKLTLFPGTLPLLRHLRRRGVRCYVVSFGEPRIQHAKVRALGLVDNPLLERVLYADRDKLLTKEAAFRQIQRESGLPAEQILVVGDRPMSEIRAGNDLGMHTVRIHRGEFVAQAPETPAEEPDYVVSDIAKVKGLAFQWGSL